MESNSIKGFDAKKVKDDIIVWIREWFAENGPGCNAVVAISGGKDSSVVAALCCQALGPDKVIGVLLPKGEQFDIDVSLALIKHLGIRHYEINIKDCFDGLMNEITAQLPQVAVQTVTNLPPRLRMAATYAVSPVLRRQSGQHLQSQRRLGRICHKIRRRSRRFQPSEQTDRAGGQGRGKGAGSAFHVRG